jgi:hypothetical protein
MYELDAADAATFEAHLLVRSECRETVEATQASVCAMRGRQNGRGDQLSSS